MTRLQAEKSAKEEMLKILQWFFTSDFVGRCSDLNTSHSVRGSDLQRTVSFTDPAWTGAIVLSLASTPTAHLTQHAHLYIRQKQGNRVEQSVAGVTSYTWIQQKGSLPTTVFLRLLSYLILVFVFTSYLKSCKINNLQIYYKT